MVQLEEVQEPAPAPAAKANAKKSKNKKKTNAPQDPRLDPSQYKFQMRDLTKETATDVENSIYAGFQFNPYDLPFYRVDPDSKEDPGALESAISRTFAEKKMAALMAMSLGPDTNTSAPGDNGKSKQQKEHDWQLLLTKLGRCLDLNVKARRFVIQTAAKSRMVWLDVQHLKEAPEQLSETTAGMGTPWGSVAGAKPLLVVRYHETTPAAMQAAQKDGSWRAMDDTALELPSKAEPQEITADESEIDALVRMMEKHHPRIDMTYRTIWEHESPHNKSGWWRCSYLLPEDPPAAKPAASCSLPGCNATNATDGTPLKGCSKCKQAKYCSREHQLQHWKAGHKRVCVPCKDQGSENKPPEVKVPDGHQGLLGQADVQRIVAKLSEQNKSGTGVDPSFL